MWDKDRCQGPVRIWNPENFCWYNPESWALESRIQLKESIICQRLESGSKLHWGGIQNPGSSIRNPQSKTILDYLTSVGQHSFGTSNISPPFNSPAANHSPFIPYKLVIAIYMPKGQGSIYLVLWRWRTFNDFKSSDLRRQPSGFTRCIAERILLCSGVVFFLRAKDLSFFYIQRWENPSVSQ